MTIVKGTGVAARNRKSTGDQTFYQLRGQTVQRARVTPRNPNTLDQQKVRRRMAEGDVLYGMFAEAANVGLHPPKRLWTPENYFKHMNSTEGRIEVDDELNVTVHFEDVVCARGKVRLVDGEVGRGDEDGAAGTGAGDDGGVAPADVGPGVRAGGGDGADGREAGGGGNEG